MRARFILSETWANLTRNLSMLLSLTLVTFISFLFIGASCLNAVITSWRATAMTRSRPVWLCPDAPSQSTVLRQIALSRDHGNCRNHSR